MRLDFNRSDKNQINEAALTKQIKALVLQERYEEAQKALADVDISHIRNESLLCLVGEVYMGLKQYDDAEQVLLRVYEKKPNTRRILDLLTTLYIEKAEYSEAEYYYKEFIGVASKDLHRYILRYRLDKSKGERLSVLIDTLEKLKDYEYIEEWAYELASLYNKNGDTKKCIHECDEIVLWFGHGEFVDKAIALKCELTGQPLPEQTTVQMHKAEEERVAEQERVAREATMNLQKSIVEDSYDGSIDVDMIQRAIDSKKAAKAEEDEEAAPASGTVAAEPAPETREDVPASETEEDEAAPESENMLLHHLDESDYDDIEDEDAVQMDDNEDEDEVIAAEISPVDAKNDKDNIAHMFSSFMTGFGSRIKSKVEELEELKADSESDNENASPEEIVFGPVKKAQEEQTETVAAESTEAAATEAEQAAEEPAAAETVAEKPAAEADDHEAVAEEIAEEALPQEETEEVSPAETASEIAAEEISKASIDEETPAEAAVKAENKGEAVAEAVEAVEERAEAVVEAAYEKLMSKARKVFARTTDKAAEEVPEAEVPAEEPAAEEVPAADETPAEIPEVTEAEETTETAEISEEAESEVVAEEAEEIPEEAEADEDSEDEEETEEASAEEEFSDEPVPNVLFEDAEKITDELAPEIAEVMDVPELDEIARQMEAVVPEVLFADVDDDDDEVHIEEKSAIIRDNDFDEDDDDDDDEDEIIDDNDDDDDEVIDSFEEDSLIFEEAGKHVEIPEEEDEPEEDEESEEEDESEDEEESEEEDESEEEEESEEEDESEEEEESEEEDEPVEEEESEEEGEPEESVAEKTPAEEPVAEEAATEEPVAEEAATEEPVAEEPAAEEAPAEEPVAEEAPAEETEEDEVITEEPESGEKLLKDMFAFGFASDYDDMVEDDGDEDDDDNDELIAPEAIIEAVEDDIMAEDEVMDDDDEDEVIDDEEDEFMDDDDEDEIIEDDDEDEVFTGDDEIEEMFAEAEEEPDEDDEISDNVKASDTVMNIFGSVAGVKSIKEQLTKTFTQFEDPALDHMDLLAPYDINFVVTGDDMSVKSQIAIGIAKALNTYGVCDKNKLVRATAQELNNRNFKVIFSKLDGGCLIIENANQLNSAAAGTIEDYIKQDNQSCAIVLEGKEEAIIDLFKDHPVLRSKFLNFIHIGKYNEDELVQLAAGYAKKKGYDMSENASAKLAGLLKERMRDGSSVNYEDIMAIIEEAVSSLEKRNMKNLFMTVLDNKYEEAAMFMLQPEDFDNINIPD